MENSFLNWSEKVPSDSRTINLLGIYHHLNIQKEFVPGITSVTERIRYYTLRAFYWQYLKKDISSNDFEKIFILTCLAHHDGENKNPHLKNVFNNTKFKKNWDSKTIFDLNFQIMGNASNYYNRQMEILRCAWTDELGKPSFSDINKKLADSLGELPISFFKKKSFTKSELKEIGEKGFCICSLEDHPEEINIMSKLLFGFFDIGDNGWDINNEEYELFQNGNLNLDFKGQNEFFSEKESIMELNMRRRNTLFMFLKIIDSVSPSYKPDLEFKRNIWDAIYFSQNRNTHSYFDFGRLNNIKNYWEFFQLSVYYVYVIEKFLDVIQEIVANNSGIEKNKVLDQIDEDEFNDNLKNIIGNELNGFSTVKDLLEAINITNGISKTNLDSKINECKLFDQLYGAETKENKLANVLIFLILLYNRYDQIDKKIRLYNLRNNSEDLETLSMNALFNFIKINPDKPINEVLDSICKLIINKHLYETAIRLSAGTHNWIFLEEDNRLYFERKDYVRFRPQDNRWFSMRDLLKDLKFIELSDNTVNIADKGLKWLERIK